MSSVGRVPDPPNSPVASVIAPVEEVEDVQREEEVAQQYESLDLTVQSQYPNNMVAEQESSSNRSDEEVAKIVG
eukprot:3480198-Karenia_brevis.AAC.1